MKKIIAAAAAAVLFISLTPGVQAQGFFNQQGAMIKKCIEQIGLLSIYIRQAEEGYGIIDKGLSTVKSIKNGEFDLHDGYYHSLKAINPYIKDYPRLKEAITNATGILALGSRLLSGVSNSAWLSPPEIKYLTGVFTKLMEEADKDLRTLTELVTPGKLSLTDDERMRRIDALCMELSSKYGFARKFATSVNVLITNRDGGSRDNKMIDKLYNNKN